MQMDPNSREIRWSIKFLFNAICAKGRVTQFRELTQCDNILWNYQIKSFKVLQLSV